VLGGGDHGQPKFHPVSAASGAGMPRKKDPDHGYAVQPDSGGEVVHIHPKRGETLV